MGRLRSWLIGIPQRFWFIPAIFIAGAMALAQILVTVDRAGAALPAFAEGFLFATGVDGARALLSAVASFLGVAGTAFSITISVISTASTSYGPRLVRNFMRDRNNQIVLGVLVATFVYTLLVLRTIRSASDDGDAFVPHLAVNAAIGLGVVDVFLFVWFIHHIAGSVQIDNLVKGATVDFGRAVRDNWLDPDDRHVEAFEPPSEGGGVVTLGRTGYLTRIDVAALANDITAADASVRVIVIDSDERRAYEQGKREQAMERARQKLEKLKERVAAGGVKQPEKIGAAVERIMQRYHGYRYFEWKLVGGALEFSESPTHFEREKRIEGKYVIATSEKGLSVLDAVALYKDLTELELSLIHI
mgnify:CR=1 FL=1